MLAMKRCGHLKGPPYAMSQQLPSSAIHPLAPEFISAAALYSAPIDVDSAVARLPQLWNVDITPHWEEIPASETSPGGRLLHFDVDGVTSMLSVIPRPLEVERGRLPEHSFYLAITLYAPLVGEQAGSSHEANDLSNASTPQQQDVGLRRRARMVAAHTMLTQLSDALMREPAAVGVYRTELGVVHPPEMITSLAELLTEGRAPLPLWVGVRTFHPDLTHGRTLGLPMFGHLDLEIMDSTRSEEDVYELLANVADYIVAGDSYLLPGQTVGFRDGEELALTQATSPADQMPVVRIAF
ncbi:hypothetical protein DDD63_11490 [Actinobaculum sp. 313]|nr:hypothetical protein DDD63_11490 [Actinobaculum sp. 313]